MEQYKKLLDKLKWRRDYFKNIGFEMLAGEYTEAIEAIEVLIEQNKVIGEKKDV